VTRDDARSQPKKARRARVAAAAAEHGWHEKFDDVAWNVWIYERSGRVIIIGYRQAGAVTGATRMYMAASGHVRKDMRIDELTPGPRKGRSGSELAGGVVAS